MPKFVEPYDIDITQYFENLKLFAEKREWKAYWLCVRTSLYAARTNAAVAKTNRLYAKTQKLRKEWDIEVEVQEFKHNTLHKF